LTWEATDLLQAGVYRLKLTLTTSKGVNVDFFTFEVLCPIGETCPVATAVVEEPEVLEVAVEVNTAPVFEDEIEPFEDLLQYAPASNYQLPLIIDAEDDEVWVTAEVIKGDETGLFMTYKQESSELAVSAAIAGDYVIQITLTDARNPELQTVYQIDLFVEEGEEPLVEPEEEAEGEEETVEESGG